MTRYYPALKNKSDKIKWSGRLKQYSPKFSTEIYEVLINKCFPSGEEEIIRQGGVGARVTAEHQDKKVSGDCGVFILRD